MTAQRRRPSAPPAPTYPRISYLIKDVERAVRAALEDIVTPMGLTAIQYTALSILALHPGTSSAQLARRSFVSAQAANEMVTALERRGMIDRRAGPEGGRALWIRLTPAGRRVLSKCETKVEAFEARLFASVSREELARFREMLVACRDAARPPHTATRRSVRRASAS